ncbi:MAG: hypothetical protein NkDv07_0291 [Candidatus Improbicoccus devescovinae]|nr:MAG: hypothetical protein NkDv07_0291 [Candidatus Improbicoccus devescovinae]
MWNEKIYQKILVSILLVGMFLCLEPSRIAASTASSSSSELAFHVSPKLLAFCEVGLKPTAIVSVEEPGPHGWFFFGPHATGGETPVCFRHYIPVFGLYCPTFGGYFSGAARKQTSEITNWIKASFDLDAPAVAYVKRKEARSQEFQPLNSPVIPGADEHPCIVVAKAPGQLGFPPPWWV